ncbi:unnamed protein product [Cuscuta campestris]|uniref:Retrovirus-related Pol polyprotein from transposon TNT 1-94-like beta-barrel domain-containing protein n=1 Tax=Cuscuta campestris TaxID=132261 RepID=A0A484NGP8_9ASTE|nr:unnamed protein product [Cuscuta campestris]
MVRSRDDGVAKDLGDGGYEILGDILGFSFGPLSKLNSLPQMAIFCGITSALDVTGMGDIVLKTPVGFWTLKDVKVVPALKKSLISVRQLDEQGHEVKFRDGQWKVVKGNLVMARGKKRGSLYMKKVVCAREKPRATGQTQDERAWKGSRGPVRGIYGNGSSRGASAKLHRRQWVRRTSIPAVGTSPENFLLSMESVCSQDVPGSGSVHLQWEPVGTKDESGADLAVTNGLELGRASTGLSVV